MNIRTMTPKLAAEIETALRTGEAIRSVAMRLRVSRKRVEDISTAERLRGDGGVTVGEERQMLGPEPLPAGCAITVGALPVLACLQGVEV